MNPFPHGRRKSTVTIHDNLNLHETKPEPPSFTYRQCWASCSTWQDGLIDGNQTTLLCRPREDGNSPLEGRKMSGPQEYTWGNRNPWAKKINDSNHESLSKIYLEIITSILFNQWTLIVCTVSFYVRQANLNDAFTLKISWFESLLL